MPSLLCVAVLIGGSAYAGFTVSKKMNPSPNLSDHYHYESLVMYLPPILLAMLLGLWLSRAFFDLRLMSSIGTLETCQPARATCGYRGGAEMAGYGQIDANDSKQLAYPALRFPDRLSLSET
jgi:hypothetical protein